MTVWPLHSSNFILLILFNECLQTWNKFSNERKWQIFLGRTDYFTTLVMLWKNKAISAKSAKRTHHLVMHCHLICRINIIINPPIYVRQTSRCCLGAISFWQFVRLCLTRGTTLHWSASYCLTNIWNCVQNDFVWEEMKLPLSDNKFIVTAVDWGRLGHCDRLAAYSYSHTVVASLPLREYPHFCVVFLSQWMAITLACVVRVG